jgi:multisubunit Na+/H+ antiporter MnhB subunit
MAWFSTYNGGVSFGSVSIMVVAAVAMVLMRLLRDKMKLKDDTYKTIMAILAGVILVLVGLGSCTLVNAFAKPKSS